jgi:thiamine-monophosphate kinase
MSDETLTEFGLIERLTRNLSTERDVIEGVGDDCAVLDLHNNDLLLATCDSQIEGVHFTLDTSSAEQIGQKALAINLSDIAAMGGTPRYALISLVLPKHIQAAWLERLYEGLHEEAKRSATTIVGGNIAGAGTAEQLIIDITLLGTVKRGHAQWRSCWRYIMCHGHTGRLRRRSFHLVQFVHPLPTRGLSLRARALSHTATTHP